MEGKYTLELNYPGDGRSFLNFWDWRQGEDVCAEIKDGKLFLMDGEGEKTKEVSFAEYIAQVEKSINK